MRKDNIIDNYHGRLINDPYRWLEDIESDETKGFIKDHNDKTKSFISTHGEFKEIKEEMIKYSTFDKGAVPVIKGEHYYFFFKGAIDNQPILYRAKDVYGHREVLVNPNELSKEGICAITGFWVNEKKDILAYGISEKGSDWQTIYFKDMISGQLLKDKLSWCKFSSLCWIDGGESVVYTRYPSSYDIHDHKITLHNMVSVHKLGTNQEEDEDIIDGVEESENSYYLHITRDEKYLVMGKSRPFGKGSVMAMELTSILEEKVNHIKENFNSHFKPIIIDKEERFAFLGNENNKFYFLTDYKAPNKRIIEIDIHNQEEINWKTIIEENNTIPMETAIFNGTHFIIINMEDGHHTLHSYDIANKDFRDIELPTLGAIDGIQSCGADEIFISFSSFFVPTTIYKFTLKNNELKVVWKPDADINFNDYVTEQVFVKSIDGTKIPMFINRRKDMELNSNNRTVLYAYGGFNANRIPEYRGAEVVWIKRGAIYAVANIRGGSEYGESWHKAGMLHNKQNCFDDFISCGQWLIDNNYTSNKKLAIRGRSNGGLLTASCMIQRPDLFGAVISQVPVIDMLRYHKYTVGRYWIPEYGDAENNKADFLNMIKYSPLHNIKYGSIYPPVLIATGDSDDRVLPCHSYKFAATLEEATPIDNRVFLRVEKDAGHGQGKPLSKLIDVEVDIYSFLEKVLG